LGKEDSKNISGVLLSQATNSKAANFGIAEKVTGFFISAEFILSAGYAEKSPFFV
jgi:hypothetical protein